MQVFDDLPVMRLAAGVSATIAAIVMALTTSSCGGDKAPRTTPSALATSSPEPKELATALLLTKDDFPVGWVHKAAAPEPPADATPESDPFSACFVRRFDHELARAVGGEWSNENTTTLSINPSVFVFDDAAHVGTGASALLAQWQCVADKVGSGVDVDETFGLGPTYTEPIDPAAYGGARALRAYNTQIYKSMNPPRTDVLVFDVVVIVEGNVLYEVEGFQRFTPIDPQLLRTFVMEAREKVVQANN